MSSFTYAAVFSAHFGLKNRFAKQLMIRPGVRYGFERQADIAVIPAQAGIHFATLATICFINILCAELDSRLRGNGGVV
ncbi:hypothetical protein [Conchiformibius kuhniae]|uniref:Uncharacterized protein n=1 Tax=Conchiformibius kuhniae TaxID=211502 RepID=A0A8T9MSH1_9NEIS|nr:hypothetical protein [Conchiformibius kuhniae]UOP04850.1 hypothetical protein LVJ77_00205 [Conchiformibius kuhniae]